jgi:protein SHQ1
MTSHERRVARLAHEEASFSPDHYLADLMESTEMIEYLCQFRPAWCQQLTAWKEMKSQKKELREPNQDIIPFSDAEKMQLKELPNKEFLLDKAAERVLYLGLVDIIFAYAYDYRITEGEHNVESAWTICKISSTLSWLEVFRGSVGEVVYCIVRRSLCYPLYRHWQLVQCVLHDTVQLFQLGRRKLLQCLLAVRGILNSAEPYYIMNNLYISDYCVWIQKASAKQIQNLALELNQVQVEKSSIGWELEELEQAAYLVAARDTAQQSEEENEQESVTSTSSSDERDTESASHEDNCRHESISDAETSTERSEGHIVDGGNCSATGRDSVSTTAVVGESIDTSHAREATKNDNCGEAIADLSDGAKAVQENSEVEREYISTQQPKPTKSGPLSRLSDSGTPTLHPDCICDVGVDVGGLTQDLHTLLTLQPQQHTPTTSAQNLIEELN